MGNEHWLKLEINPFSMYQHVISILNAKYVQWPSIHRDAWHISESQVRCLSRV